MKKYIALYFEEVFDGTNEVMIRAIAGGDSAAKCKKAVLESRTPWGSLSDDTWETLIKEVIPDLEDAKTDELVNADYSYFDNHWGCEGYYNWSDSDCFYMKNDDSVTRVLIGVNKGTADLKRSYYEVIVRSDEEDFESCTERFADMVIDTRGHDH